MSERKRPGGDTASVVLVLGVGNAMKGDDGVGPFVATRLNQICAQLEEERSGDDCGIVALDCGTTPENYTSVVRRMRPRLLVIVDAAEMGLQAGECRIVPEDRVGALSLSTHSMPLSLFMSYVADLVEEIAIVGVQPAGMALGTGLSPEVSVAAETLVARLLQGALRGLPVLA